MSLRAKMRCQDVREKFQGPKDSEAKFAEDVYLSPVYGKDGTSNGQWSKWTPSGMLQLTITNSDAWGKLKVGAFYLVDLSETTEEA